MPNLTTRMDLTSTTIQIRSDDAKSNFMNFDHSWEAVSAIKVSAKVVKTEIFQTVFNTLKAYEKEYINLVCNHTEFDKVKRYYLPDWVFLEGEDDTMEAAVCSVIVEMVTGLRPEDNHGMFKAIVTGIEMDIDAEIGFPVLD